MTLWQIILGAPAAVGALVWVIGAATDNEDLKAVGVFFGLVTLLAIAAYIGSIFWAWP